MHTQNELQLIERLGTPKQICGYIEGIRYDYWAAWFNYTVLSFRETVKRQKGLCLSAAFAAAHLLEEHGQEPTLIVTAAWGRAHCLAIYEEDNKVGAIGKGKSSPLTHIPAAYHSIADLAREMERRYTRDGASLKYSGIVELRRLTGVDWRFSTTDLAEVRVMEHIEDLLIRV